MQDKSPTTDQEETLRRVLKNNVERLIQKEWGRSSDSYFADLLSGGQTIEQTLEDILSFEIEFEKDGNMWCAHGYDFINLQESYAAFGATKKEAAENYYAGN